MLISVVLALIILVLGTLFLRSEIGSVLLKPQHLFATGVGSLLCSWPALIVNAYMVHTAVDKIGVLVASLPITISLVIWFGIALNSGKRDQLSTNRKAIAFASACLGFGILSFVLVYRLNIALDDSPEVRLTVQPDAYKRDVVHYSKQGDKIYYWVEDWRDNETGPLRIHLNYRVHDAWQLPDPKPLHIGYRQGFFGINWISSLQESDE